MPLTPLDPTVACSDDRRYSTASSRSGKSKGSGKRPEIEFKDVSVRRGTRVCDVLMNMGAIWKSCKGSAETYGMSVPVQGLNVFISHNWSTARLHKFLALALYFNFWLAVAAGVSISAVLGTAEVLGYLPLFNHWGTYTYIGPYVLIAVYILSNVTLLCGHEIVGRLGFLRSCQKTVFLDKTCIHQTDKDLQRRGLEALTAFLNASDEILVIYTDTYLRKLWTVYELVSVIVIRQAPRITVLATDFSFLVFCWWGGFFWTSLAYSLMYSEEVQEATRQPFTVDVMLMGGMSPIMLLLILHLRMWSRTRKRMLSAVKNFSIHAAECTVAADRRTVYRNVSILMRDFGFVPAEASEDDALDCFDALARDLIPPHLDASFGTTGIPYKNIFLMSSPLLATGVDHLACNASLRPGAKWFLAEALWYVAEACIIIPLWVALACWATSFGQRLKRWREVLFLGILWPMMIVVYWSLRQVTFFLYFVGIASWVGLAVEALIVGLAGALVAFIYRPRRVRPHVQERWKQRFSEDLELETTVGGTQSWSSSSVFSV